MTCDLCSKEANRLRCENSVWVCRDCLPRIPVGEYGPLVINTVNLPDYGNVSVKRIDEARRRVILPTAAAPGEYHLGRRGENGKVQDREPSY